MPGVERRQSLRLGKGGASSVRVIERGYLRFQVGKRAGQLFPVARGLSRLQVILYTRAGKKEHFPAAPYLKLCRSQHPLYFPAVSLLKFLHLPLDRLAFPSSRHAIILQARYTEPP